MATTSYQKSTTEAKGDVSRRPSPDGPTPAPIKPVLPPGELGNRLDQNRGAGYGRNQSSLPSSLSPGYQVQSDFSIAPPDGDPALEIVKAQGSARKQTTADTSGRIGAFRDDGQLRQIGSGNVPVHPAMRGAADGPKVPNAIDKGAVENVVRKPPSVR
jgi:hypothetical protein